MPQSGAMLDQIGDIMPQILAAATLVVDLLATGHAVLYRRDVRSTIAWVGLIWFVPLVGAALYVLLGINRVKRRALSLRGAPNHGPSPGAGDRCTGQQVGESLDVPSVAALVAVVDEVVHHPVLAGNRITLLVNGDQAFPAMLKAIDAATRSIALSTYIFDSDRAGRGFVEALGRAVSRGVEVRVLIDAVGVRYARPPVHRLLKRARVPVARFLPTMIPWRFRYMNLRIHRKIMVVDGQIGFTGGMNIREGNLHRLRPPPKHPIADLHARVDGPVVAHLQEAFVEDWAFATRERLDGPVWFPPLGCEGNVFARGIPDGPDEDFEELRLTLLGALAVAQSRVRIVTPYFLPDATLISAVNIAVMRGVQVDIVVPAKSNLRLVQWACMANLWQLLERGCRIWLTPPPFDHTKLMVVDGAWVLLGSGNWDARSLRLNFEFNLECYDRALAAMAAVLVDQRIAAGTELSLADVSSRSLPVRLRDGLARLLTPYL